MSTAFKLNGRAVTARSAPDTPLLWVLRDEFSLPGTRFGCGIAQCGACTVHVDAVAQRACAVPVQAVEGRAVVAIDAQDTEDAEPGALEREMSAFESVFGTDIVRLSYRLTGDSAKPLDVRRYEEA